MTADEAVEKVARYVKRTNSGASEAVKKLWPELQPIDGVETLAQFALAQLVSLTLRRPLHAAARSSVSGTRNIDVSITHAPRLMKRYEVTVELLRETHYKVNGREKPVVSFNQHDLSVLIRNAEAAENGFARYRKVWEYAKERLATLKKDKIDDLADGEQTKLARMLYDCQTQSFPADLPVLPHG